MAPFGITPSCLTRVALAAVGATAASLPFATPAFGTGSPVTRGVCQAPKRTPKEITLAADGSAFLAAYRKPGHERYGGPRVPGLRWSSWTATRATAHGYEWIDDGYPSVGGGTYYAIRVDIRLWRPLDGIFTRMRVTSHAKKSFHPNRYWTNPPAQHTFNASSCGSGTWSW
jgi:hypothetical protein